MITYAICSLLWAWSLRSRKNYAVLMVALIPLSEILQLPLPYRTVSIHDMIANLAGVLIGFSVNSLYFLTKSHGKERVKKLDA